MSGARLIIMNTASSFVACASSGCLNSIIMRRTEMKKGIDVLDKDGIAYGQSQTCAKHAVFQTAVSRFIVMLPMFGPAFALYAIERMKMMPKTALGVSLLQFVLLFLDLYVSVPLSISAYP